MQVFPHLHRTCPMVSAVEALLRCNMSLRRTPAINFAGQTPPPGKRHVRPQPLLHMAQQDRSCRITPGTGAVLSQFPDACPGL